MIKIISTLSLDELVKLKNESIKLNNNCFNEKIYDLNEYFIFEDYFNRNDSISLIGDILWHFLQSKKELHVYIIEQKEYEKKYKFFDDVCLTKNLGIFNDNVELGDPRILKIEERKYNLTEDIFNVMKDFKKHNFKDNKIYHCLFK